MVISSRTPEGQSNHCPVCDSEVIVEPSLLFGDATCPKCGSFLWFLNLHSQAYVFERHARGTRDRVIAILAELLGVDPQKITDGTSFVSDFGADSLDTAELIMVLEEEFDLD